ncbi:MAG: hypothetical protein LBT00_08095 [Spirochaetaceae bacterium]|nr:hypothetical protein [Spirochaetaceae bacterium]
MRCHCEAGRVKQSSVRHCERAARESGRSNPEGNAKRLPAIPSGLLWAAPSQ